MQFKQVAVALATTMMIGCAVAAPVTFTGFAHGHQDVRGQLSAPNVARDLTVHAGGFRTISGAESFVSYCVDFYQWLPSFGSVNNSYTSADAASFFGARFDAVTRLFSGRSAEVDSAVESAAFQIALWEIFYEAPGTAYNTSSGSAMFSDAGDDARSLAQTYLNGLSGYGVNMAVHVLKSTSHQDVVWASRVPEPGTAVLMLAGVLGLGAIRRRKQPHR